MCDRIYGVLLFDNETSQRDALRDELTEAGFRVHAVGAVTDVLAEVRTHRDRYDFAVFDLDFGKLGTGIAEAENANITDGLRMSQTVASIDPTLPIILYHDTSLADLSHYPGNEPPSESQAIAAGAYRLVVQRGVRSVLSELVTTLKELKEIAQELRRLKDARENMSHLVLGLGVGFQVVDERGKVWFTDQEFDRVVGASGRDERICYCQSHGYELAHRMCHNCIVRKVMREGEPDFAMFYSPVYPQGPGSQPVFSYLCVRATPIFSNKSNESDKSDEKKHRGKRRVIAAIEAVSHVTSAFIESLSLTKHLEMLANGLQDMGFRRVFFFRSHANTTPSGGGELVGILARCMLADGTPETIDISEVFIPIHSGPTHNPGGTLGARGCQDEHKQRLHISEAVQDKLGLITTHCYLSVPLFGSQKECIGWVLLDNAGPGWEKRSDKPVEWCDLEPPACKGCIPPKPIDLISEITRVLQSKPWGGEVGAHGLGVQFAEEEHRYERVCLRVAGATRADPVETIGLILGAVREEMHGIAMAHVRSIDGDLALSVKSVGEYGKIASEQIDIGTSHRLTAQVARTGLSIIVGDIDREYGDQPPGFNEFSPNARTLLLAHKSHAVLPIRNELRTIGTLSCQAKSAGFFTENRVRFLRMVCSLISRALDDLTMFQALKTASELPRNAAMMIAHNLAQPVGIIQRCVQLLRQDIVRDLSATESWLAQIERQCNRLALMKNNLVALAQTVSTKSSTIQSEQIETRMTIESIAKQWTEGQNVTAEVVVGEGLEICRVPRAIMEMCLGVMIPNAIEAMEGMPDSDRRLCVRAAMTNIGELSFDVIDAGPGISDAVARNLFSPLKSAKSTGMGIGLAIARQIARSAGGDLYWSRVDNKTVFSLRLKQ